MSFDSDEVEQRLKILESKLLSLQKELSITEKIAKQIQGLVTQNRFPQVQGIEFLSRYIPGEQNRAEGFDFFLNSKKNQSLAFLLQRSLLWFEHITLSNLFTSARENFF